MDNREDQFADSAQDAGLFVRASDRIFWIGAAAIVAAFFLIRLVVILSSPERIHNVDNAELSLLVAAKTLAVQGPGAPSCVGEFPHLQGRCADIYLLRALGRIVGFNYLSMKILAMLISFATLLLWMTAMRRAFGNSPALAAGALLLFPPLQFFKWSLMLWGAYPESALLSAAVVACAVFSGGEGWSGRLFTLTLGFVAGLSVSYNTINVHLILLAALTVPLSGSFRQITRRAPLLAVGLVAGLEPLRRYYAGRGDVVFAFHPDITNLGGAGSSLVTQFLSGGGESPLAFVRMNVLALFDGNPVFALAGVFALGFCAVLAVRFKAYRAPALIIPAGAVLLLAAFSFSSINRSFGYRHMMSIAPFWFAAAAVTGTVRLSKWLETCPWSPLISSFYRVTRRLMRGLLAPFRFRSAGDGPIHLPQNLGGILYSTAWLLAGAGWCALHAYAVAPLIRPNDLGQIEKFRALEYSRMLLGSAVGDEVPRLNCVIDSGRLKDGQFRTGFGFAFPIHGFYYCCIWKAPEVDGQEAAYRYNLHKYGDEADRSELARGFGFGLAIKGYNPNQADVFLEMVGESFAEPFHQGYNEGRASPCAGPVRSWPFAWKLEGSRP